VKVGDLVTIADEPSDDRRVGTIMRFSTFESDCGWKTFTPPEPIVEVLWNTGVLGWILKERVEVISESR
jgi:hypothetical protein